MNFTGLLEKKKTTLTVYKRKLTLNDLDEILKLQEIVQQNLKDQTLYSCADQAYFTTMLQNPDCYSSGYFIKIPQPLLQNKYPQKDKTKLISFAFAIPWKDDKENYGYDLDLPEEEINSCMNFEFFVVHPDWRGNKIQSLHIQECLTAAEKMGMTYAAATVSPENLHSLRNFIDNGFTEYCQKEKYGGLNRSILFKKLQKENINIDNLSNTNLYTQKLTEYTSCFLDIEAKEYCYKLMKQLDENKSLCSDEENNMNPFYSTNQLIKRNCGHMFGILVCKEKETEKKVILKAFSGQYFGSWNIPGWVPPALDTNAFVQEVLNTDYKIKELTNKIFELESNSYTRTQELTELKKERKAITQCSLRRIYDMYSFTCIDGSTYTFADTEPATGTGDCCAPKLLNYAFRNNLIPISLAEFYYGIDNKSKTKINKSFYPPCRTKCAKILPFILGLDILYRDKDIIVVNKQADLLSVPGIGPQNQDCIVSRVKRLIPNCIEQPSVHRLDMETSGVMVLALTEEAHKELSRQFRDGQIQKQYMALLRGSFYSSEGEIAQKIKQNAKMLIHSKGKIELPFRLDVENRPYQIYDSENGKIGVTLFEHLGEEKINKKTVTRILFTPLTGRTHQLRLHSSHLKGLGLSIVGDTLYGTREKDEKRMMLHARQLFFVHPITKEPMNFFCKEEF